MSAHPHLARIRENYRHFMARPEIVAFTLRGGKVFIATENRSASEVAALLEEGHLHFAEKFWQEMRHKWPELLQRYPKVTSNYFGRLQTNKVRGGLGLCSGLESLDRPRLALRVASLLKDLPGAPSILVQINVGRDPAKTGISPEECDSFIRWCREELRLPNDYSVAIDEGATAIRIGRVIFEPKEAGIRPEFFEERPRENALTSVE